jgi:hypothetical protein
MQSIIGPDILYGRETWFVILKEENRLRVLKNRVLRKRFGPKRPEATSGWKELHIDYPHNKEDQINEDEMYRTCSMHGIIRNTYTILVGEFEGSR